MTKRIERFESIKEEVEKAVKPFVKVKLYKPEGHEMKELEDLQHDEEFNERLERLVRLYLDEKKEEIFLMIIPVSSGVLPKDRLKELEMDKTFIAKLEEFIRGFVEGHGSSTVD